MFQQERRGWYRFSENAIAADRGDEGGSAEFVGEGDGGHGGIERGRLWPVRAPEPTGEVLGCRGEKRDLHVVQDSFSCVRGRVGTPGSRRIRCSEPLGEKGDRRLRLPRHHPPSLPPPARSTKSA